MEGSILSICIIAAIALAVFLGYKTKINTGFFCIVFAYVIGCFVMGLKPKALIGYWPTNTMFVILAVSLFYNVAAANGTLEKISRSLLYACRKFPGLLPYALATFAVGMALLGWTAAQAANAGWLTPFPESSRAKLTDGVLKGPVESATYQDKLGLDVERFQADRRAPEVHARITADFRSGIRAGVATTPTLFLPDGERVSGRPDEAAWARIAAL